MKESTRKIITWISLAFALIMSVFAILFAANQEKFGGMFDIAFWGLICLVCLSLVLWLFYGILKVVKNPKKPLIAAGIIIVVIGAAFLLANGDSMPQDFLTRYETSESTAKLISTACYTTYFVVLASVVLMIFAEISKAFKK
ncbi:MAG: hypothetical protein IKN84_03880 [Bacteroidales bacterium]|jgi:hypothetical protein|nr:hypothetical protein [Bacteroidales bacterium]